LDIKAATLKLSSDSETDNVNESDDETMVPIYGKGKSGVFSTLAGQDSDDDNTENEGSISENSNKADGIEESKQGKTNMKARDKPDEAKELSKQQTATKLKEEGKGKGKKNKKGLKKDDDLDALLADLEKPVEKVSKEKKKKKVSGVNVACIEVRAGEDLKISSATENIAGKLFIRFKLAGCSDFEKIGEAATLVADGDIMAKRKDKRKKKKGTTEKEKPAEFESPVEGDVVSLENQTANDVVEKKKRKKGDVKKDEDKKETKKKKHVNFIKEILRRKQEEEERMLKEQKEEEERLIAQQKAKEEEERLAKEKREREKQKKKERDEKLKAEGKYLTPAQKEKLRRQQALLANSNIILPSALRRDSDDVPVKRPIYGKKKPKKELKCDKESIKPLPAAEIRPSGYLEVKPQGEVMPISWDAIDEVIDDWENMHGEEHEEVASCTVERVVEAATAGEDEMVSMEVESGTFIEETEGSDSSEEFDEEDEEETSDDEQENRESKEQLKEKVRARLKKRREQAEAKRSTNNLRSPVICVLGHVDTGKTKMLDTIRRTNVQDGEAGGITQQIGATQVPAAAIMERTKMVRDFSGSEMKIPGLLIIDTPGHESFSNLRSRGSSLCDYAILVVDLMHGLEQQTLESFNLLRKRQTPFVIALNKIDRLYSYESNPRKDIYQHLKSQPLNTQLQFKELKDKIVLQFAEQGVNVVMANENPDLDEYISMIPTSAFLGDGIGNIMAHIVSDSQNRLAEKLAYCEELDCTVMEVKSLPGLGTTIDVILVNGSLRVGDVIVLTGTDGAIITQIRELLMPQPLKELRVKNAYEHYQMIKGAQGVKVLAKNLEKALAGLSVFVANREDELLVLKEDCEAQLCKALMAIKKKPEGVYVQASTLGSLEALLEFLRTQKIPYSNVNIGPVHKKDVQKAAAMLERKEEYACILAFDVRVDREVEQFAVSEGVRIFSADIIYHLEDSFLKYREELRLKRRRQNEHLAIFPCKLRILPQHIFNARNPIIIGVSVEAGQLKRGVPLCVPSKDSIFIGTVSSIERNHEQVEIARTGEEVCIKIENTTGEAPKLYGRHFTHQDTLVSRITRETIDVCKAHFRNDLSKADWQLVVQLKKNRCWKRSFLQTWVKEDTFSGCYKLRVLPTPEENIFNLWWRFSYSGLSRFMFVVPMMWFHTLFISKLFPKYKEYLSWSNLSLRLSLAAVLNLAISALVFQTSHIGYFEKFLCYAKECIKLRKMYELWPPHRHAVLYLIYSALVHCAIR
uniref:Eukaryotic translation initiation factor 5B n=1 Tax=Brugia timori TaxID=42155 RepID=A0A0R3QSG4_9BILA